jgi:hypothetical protein
MAGLSISFEGTVGVYRVGGFFARLIPSWFADKLRVPFKFTYNLTKTANLFDMSLPFGGKATATLAFDCVDLEIDFHGEKVFHDSFHLGYTDPIRFTAFHGIQVEGKFKVSA